MLGHLKGKSRRKGDAENHGLGPRGQSHRAYHTPRWGRPCAERHHFVGVHPRHGVPRQLQARLIVPTPGERGFRSGGKEPVVRPVWNGAPGRETVRRAGMRSIVVQDHDGWERQIERIDRERPARRCAIATHRDSQGGAGGASVRAHGRGRQPAHVPSGSMREPERRRVGRKGAHTPGRLDRQRIRDQRHARAPR